MTPAYVAVLGLFAYSIDIRLHKIDGATLSTYGMVLANFQVQDKWKKTRFFSETFLVANINTKILLEMPFPALNKVEINFAKQKLKSRMYTVDFALPTIKRM